MHRNKRNRNFTTPRICFDISFPPGTSSSSTSQSEIVSETPTLQNLKSPNTPKFPTDIDSTQTLAQLRDNPFCKISFKTSPIIIVIGKKKY